MKHIEYSVEQIRYWLSYCPDTGLMTWLNPRSRSVKPGTVAGSMGSDGYLVIGLGSHPRLLHRVIWYYMTGHWTDYPNEVIDHIDRNRTNNRWANFRLTTVMLNQQNRSVNKNSSTGVKGVSLDIKTGTYYVQKQRFNQRKMIKGIATLAEARKIYEQL